MALIEYTATAPFSKTTKCQYTRDAQLLTLSLAGSTEYNVFFNVTGFTGAGALIEGSGGA